MSYFVAFSLAFSAGIVGLSGCSAVDTIGGLGSAYRDGANFEVCRPDVSPDGRFIVFSGVSDSPPKRWPWDPKTREDSGDIYLLDLNGGHLRRLTTMPGYDGMPAFSPDGKTIAFVSERNSETEREGIYLMDVSDGTLVGLTDHSQRDRFPVFSPDGRTVYFYRYSGEIDKSIYSIDVDGTNLRQLTTDYRSVHLACSPNGELVIYPGNDQLSLLDPRTLGQRPFTGLEDYGVSSADFSADGTELLFTDMASEVAIWNMRTKTIEKIPNPPWASFVPKRAQIWNPVFLPNAEGILVFATPDAAANRGLGEIWTYDRKTKEWREISKNYSLGHAD